MHFLLKTFKIKSKNTKNLLFHFKNSGAYRLPLIIRSFSTVLGRIRSKIIRFSCFSILLVENDTKTYIGRPNISFLLKFFHFKYNLKDKSTKQIFFRIDIVCYVGPSLFQSFSKSNQLERSGKRNK